MNRNKLAELYTENNLEEEDVFIIKFSGRKIPIITREGIEKIQANKKIVVKYEMTSISIDNKNVVIKAIGKMDDIVMETYGESMPANTTQKYPVAMAEKRALSRVVLKLAGFYLLGAFSEDEADEFK